MAETKRPTTSTIASHLMKTYKSISYSVAMHVASDIIYHRNGYNNIPLKIALKTAEYLVKGYSEELRIEDQKIAKAKEKLYKKTRKPKGKKPKGKKKKESTIDIHEFRLWVAEQQEQELDIDKSEDKEYEAGKIVAGWLATVEQSYTRDMNEYAMQNRDLILEILNKAKADKKSNYDIYKAVKSVFPDAEETLEKLGNSIYDDDYRKGGKKSKKGFKRDVDRLLKALGIRTGIRNKWW